MTNDTRLVRFCQKPHQSAVDLIPLHAAATSGFWLTFSRDFAQSCWSRSQRARCRPRQSRNCRAHGNGYDIREQAVVDREVRVVTTYLPIWRARRASSSGGPNNLRKRLFRASLAPAHVFSRRYLAPLPHNTAWMVAMRIMRSRNRV